MGGVPQVLEDSRTVLVAADVLPDGPFPQDEKLKDGEVLPAPARCPGSQLLPPPVPVTQSPLEVPSHTVQEAPTGSWVL